MALTLDATQAAFETSFQTLLAAAAPSCVTNGIWELRHSQQINWNTQQFPFLVMDFEGLEDDVEGVWGAANIAVQGNVRVFWVDKTTGSGQPIRRNLLAVKNYLLDHELTTGQVISVGSPSLGTRATADLELKNEQARAGVLPVFCVVGETYS